MKVTCQACSAAFEIAPPPWVISAGRPFAMQCATCGHAQEVFPTGIAVFGDAGDPPEAIDVSDDDADAPAMFEPVDPSLISAAMPSLGGALGSLDPNLALSMPDPTAGSEPAAASEPAAEPEPERVAVPEPEVVPEPSPVAAASDAAAPTDSHPEVTDVFGTLVGADEDWKHDDDEGAFGDAGLPGADPEDVHTFAEYRHVAIRDVTSRDDAEILLRQDGEVFAVPDMGTLQRWIMEHRVEADDAVADHGGPWTRARDIPGLAVFFDALEQIEVLSSQVMPAVVPTTARPLGAGGEVPAITPGETGDATEESPPIPTQEASFFDAPPVPGHFRYKVAPTPPVADASTVDEEELEDDADTEETLPPISGLMDVMAAFDEGLEGDTKPAPDLDAPDAFFNDAVPLPPLASDEPEVAAIKSGNGWFVVVAILCIGAALWTVLANPGSSSSADVARAKATPTASAVIPLRQPAVPAEGSPDDEGVDEDDGAPDAADDPPVETTAEGSADEPVTPEPAEPEPAEPEPAAPDDVKVEATKPAPVEPAPVAAPATTRPKPAPAAPREPAPRPVAAAPEPPSAPENREPRPWNPGGTTSSAPASSPGSASLWNAGGTADEPRTPAPRPAPTPTPANATPEPVAPSTPAAPVTRPAVETGDYASLVAKGWDAADSGDLSSAIQHFEGAVSDKPNGVDANYGLGYALVKKGRLTSGRQHLCRALRGASGFDKTEIEGFLGANGLVCDEG